jgi:hypothetical protein
MATRSNARDGEKDKKSLVIRGWQRAGAWATLFGAGIETGGTYPAPARIYAADPANAEEEEPSQRPFETIKPLADRLRLTPITRWGHGDEGKIVGDINGFSGVALVCWEHKAIIASLLPAFLVGQQVQDLPPKWDGERCRAAARPGQPGRSVVLPPAVSAAASGGQQRAGAVTSVIRSLALLCLADSNAARKLLYRIDVSTIVGWRSGRGIAATQGSEGCGFALAQVSIASISATS